MLSETEGHGNEDWRPSTEEFEWHVASGRGR